MIEIFAVINQKGGVGKTTTAHNIGAAFIKKGFKVLFIDLDAQCNLTATFNIPFSEQALTSLDILLEPQKSGHSVINTDGGDIIPASPLLSGADTTITGVGKEYKLREALDIKMNGYDYIIIDTPPALGILTINALTACTSVLIPAGADIYSLQGISGLNSTVETVRKYCNPHLKIRGIILTRYNGRAILSRDIAEVLESTAEKLNTKLFKTPIRESISVKEAQANKMSVLDYAPKSNPAFDYISLADEILNAE